jgi:hypothetical protein
MATWKKVAISGSNISQFNNDSDYIIDGQSGVSLTGSFSGSFIGTTDLPDLTQGTGITAFTYDGAATATVAVSGASTLNTDNVTKWTGTAFANSSLTDNGTVITGASSIQLTGASSNLSGSFSGSFQGDGANLTGVIATAIFPVTAITDLASTDKFFVNDGANKHITYGNLLTDLAGTNLVVEGTDSLTLASTITGLTSVSATSFTGSLLGDVNGTSSFATSASYAASVNNLTNAITNNVNNNILTATGGGAINGEGNLTFDGTTLTVTGNEIITGNLTVQGTASFQHNEELQVADRFVLFASGSNTAGDGGIVIQQGTQNIGELFAFDSGTTRWGLTGSFDASNTSYTPDAFMAAVVEGAGTDPDAAPAKYDKKGNIFVGTDEGIWIYS